MSNGHSLILLRAPPSSFEQADYITFENDLNNIDFLKPISYDYFVKNLKTVSLIAVKYFGKEAGVVQEETDVIVGFAGHSTRATLITSLAHSGTEEVLIRTQGRWAASSSMVSKYTRNKEDLTVRTLKKHVDQVKKHWQTVDEDKQGPSYADQFDINSENEDSESEDKKPILNETPSPSSSDFSFSPSVQI